MSCSYSGGGRSCSLVVSLPVSIIRLLVSMEGCTIIPAVDHHQRIVFYYVLWENTQRLHIHDIQRHAHAYLDRPVRNRSVLGLLS